MAFTSYTKTADNPTVYGTTDTGQNVAFENEQQFLGTGGNFANVKTVNAAPTNVVNYSQYNKPMTPGQLQTPTTIPRNTPMTPSQLTPGNPTGVANTQTNVPMTPAQLTPGTPPVNTTQPSPTTVNATPYTNPINTVANQGLAAANASGQSAPQNAGDAAAAVTQFSAPAQAQANSSTANTNVANTLANDPGYQKLLADATTASNTITQGQSLLDQYKQMETDAGIPGINTQLLNTQAIINGTEDDIRNEVTAAGGFATNSQVLALSDARNKTLIQNYNNLLATKTNAEQQINTMIGLAGQDKQNAIQTANEQLNIDTQLNDYAQKFQTNAKEGYNQVVSAVGYSGLVNSLLNSDPTGNSLTLAEQTLGMPQGQLQQIATQEQSAKNLSIIQATGATSPYVVTPTGEVWNTSTGYAYTSAQDFQTKTGMSLDQANAKKAIQPPPPNMDALIKQAQLSKALTDAQYAPAIAQANINQSNAAAASAAAATAKTKAETAFENANGGLTPQEIQAQTDAANVVVQAQNSKAADLIGQMASGKLKWQDAYNQLHAAYPDLEVVALDSLLQSNNYRR